MGFGGLLGNSGKARRRRINLLPAEAQLQKNLNWDQILVFAAVAFALYGGLSWSQAKRNLAAKQAEYEALHAEAKQIAEKTMSMRPASAGGKTLPPVEGVSSLDQVLKNKAVWTEPFRELSGLVPRGIWLTSMTAEYDKNGARTVRLFGSAPSGQDVSEFFSTLENSYHFRNVIIRYSERLKDAMPPLYNFEFNAPLKGGEGKVASSGAEGAKTPASEDSKRKGKDEGRGAAISPGTASKVVSNADH